ncbi:MAG: hypothetical protein ACK5LC_14065 [Coprobacillaceae bacterium]
MDLMNLEVGTLVRTREQGIRKIDTIWEERPVNRYGFEVGREWDGTEYEIIKVNNIVKVSHNIIDVIEIGDYVNGCKVVKKYFNTGVYIYNDKNCGLRLCVLAEEDIKSVVTKEYFNQGEFKL